MTIIIKIATQNKKEVEYPIFEKCVIGRSHRCDLIIDDLHLSGQHGALEFDKSDKLFYTDLNSSNGSFLNRVRITETQFKVNDILQIGNSIITIDEKKLSTHEKKTIGITKLIKKNTKIFGATSSLITKKNSDFSELSKSVIINESLQERILNASGNGNEQVKISERYNGLNENDVLELDNKKKKKK